MEDVVVSQSLWGRFKSWLKKDWNETKVLFRNLPAIPFAILCICLVVMNFLANKGWVKGEWTWLSSWFSADAGMIVSWIAFLAGDMIVKIYGAKAAIKVNFMAIVIQLLAITLFTIGAALPWAYPTWTTGCGAHGFDADGIAIFEAGCEQCAAASSFNANFDAIFMAQFWPCFGGTMAFALATVVDSILSKFLLTRFKDRTSFKAYAVASYASTALGQFLDNMFFALFFSIWQGWFCATTGVGDVLLHLFGFSAIGMVVELIGQAILSPVGFWLTKSWRARGTGDEYIALVEEAQEVNKTDAVVEHTKVSPLKVLFFIGSFLSIVAACVLGILFKTEVIAMASMGWIIACVYTLAILGFVLYLCGAIVRNKKVVNKELTK